MATIPSTLRMPAFGSTVMRDLLEEQEAQSKDLLFIPCGKTLCPMSFAVSGGSNSKLLLILSMSLCLIFVTVCWTVPDGQRLVKVVSESDHTAITGVPLTESAMEVLKNVRLWPSLGKKRIHRLSITIETARARSCALHPLVNAILR